MQALHAHMPHLMTIVLGIELGSKLCGGGFMVVKEIGDVVPERHLGKWFQVQGAARKEGKGYNPKDLFLGVRSIELTFE